MPSDAGPFSGGTVPPFAFFVFGSKTVVGDVVEKSIVTAFVFALDLLSTL